MNSVELVCEGSSDICIFCVKSFLECIFGLPQGLGLSFICFNIGGEVVEFFLDREESTSTVDNLFLRDIEVIIIAYHITHQNNHSIPHCIGCSDRSLSSSAMTYAWITTLSFLDLSLTSTLAKGPICCGKLGIGSQFRPNIYPLLILNLSRITLPCVLGNTLLFS